jgi:thioredoxin reductase (NADPH)
MVYDIIIIGSGPGGLSAALYASRAGLTTLIVEKNACGGQLIITGVIENYPGFDGGIDGFDLAVRFEKQAKYFGAEIVYDEAVAIECESVKKVFAMGSAYEGRTVIVAAGTRLKKMNIPGESEFIGKGVSFCAVCDAPFYKDRDVLVIGGGDSAVQEAIYLSKFAKSVIVVHRRDKLRAAKILQERMASRQNISVIYNTVLKEISGENSVEKAVVVDVKTNENRDLKVNGVFVFIGLVPNALLFPLNLAVDESNYIVTDENMNTSIPGVFACGDIRKKHLRQIVTAASDGAQAAVSAQNYLEKYHKENKTAFCL